MSTTIAGGAVQGALTLDTVLEEVAQRREEFSQRRHVPVDMVEKFRQLGIYRSSTPKCFGGDAMAPADFLRIVERIAAVDGSTAWVASFGSANVYLAALPKETQAKLYASGPDQVFSGALYPMQPAQEQDGGWLVNGRWKFASGCMGAAWLGVGIGGGPGQRPTMAVFPASEVDIVENWDVVGLQGTGSHDLQVTNKFVTKEWTFPRGSKATIDEPLYHYPAVCYQAQVHAAVGLGLAQAALRIANEMSGGRATNTGAPRLADRSYFRVDLAKAHAMYRSVRAYYYEVAESVYASIVAGNPVTPEQASELRLSAANAGQVAGDVVMMAHRLAGMPAVYMDHPMQAVVRDSMVVTQHAFLGIGNYDGAGSILTGVDAFPGYP